MTTVSAALSKFARRLNAVEVVEVKTLDLNKALTDASVTISGYFYVVDFGPTVRPRTHYVNKERKCSCADGYKCVSVQVVADYLRKGGPRAPEPSHGFYPYAPEKCPVCGAKAFQDNSLGSRNRGTGWACAKTGATHYWADRARIIQEAQAANPWRFPPVVIREGVQQYAWDGTQTTDQVLYPGILRADLVTEGPIGYAE